MVEMVTMTFDEQVAALLQRRLVDDEGGAADSPGIRPPGGAGGAVGVDAVAECGSRGGRSRAR